METWKTCIDIVCRFKCNSIWWHFCMQSPLRKLPIWKPTSAGNERQPISNKAKRRFVASRRKAKLPCGVYHILKKTIL